MANRDYKSGVHRLRFATDRQTCQFGKSRIGQMHGDPLPEPYSGSVLTMHPVEHLMLAVANQLDLWARGVACDPFRREYLTELVAELHDHATGE